MEQNNFEQTSLVVVETKEPKRKKAWLFGGRMIVAAAALIIGFSSFGGVPNAARPSDVGRLTSVKTAYRNSVQDEDAGTNMRIFDMRMRWRGDKWEYSTDGGNVWTETAPDGVKVSADGGLTMWGGEGKPEDFDLDAYRQEIDKTLRDIIASQNKLLSDVMPEGIEGGSFFSAGGTVARKTDGAWEFSSDGGKTWSKEPPDGVKVSEDGSRIRIGGGEIVSNGYDSETDFDEWFNKWHEGFDGSGSKASGTSV